LIVRPRQYGQIRLGNSPERTHIRNRIHGTRARTGSGSGDVHLWPRPEAALCDYPSGVDLWSTGEALTAHLKQDYDRIGICGPRWSCLMPENTARANETGLASDYTVQRSTRSSVCKVKRTAVVFLLSLVPCRSGTLLNSILTDDQPTRASVRSS
jgi:hypothetical protein